MLPEQDIPNLVYNVNHLPQVRSASERWL